MYEFLDRRYALALYEACSEAGNVEVVFQQLKEIVNEIDSNKDFMEIIKSPQISKSNKKRIFKELFEDTIEPELLNFLLLTIEKERILFLREKYNQFELIYLDAKNIILVDIKSAIYLTNDEKINLKHVLEEKYKKKIILREKIDSSLIGGMILRVGDEVIDGSVKEKLCSFKKRINDIDIKNDDSLYTRPINNKYISKEDISLEYLDAEVTTAVKLTDDERIRLIKGLESFYDRKIRIHEFVDKDIIGGILVKVGNDITDYTIKEKVRYIQRS